MVASEGSHPLDQPLFNELSTYFSQQHLSRQILGAHLVVAMAQIFLAKLANLWARTGGEPGLSVFHALNWMSMHLYLSDLWSQF